MIPNVHTTTFKRFGITLNQPLTKTARNRLIADYDLSYYADSKAPYLPNIVIGKSLDAAAFRDTVAFGDGRFGKVSEGEEITKIKPIIGKGTKTELRVAPLLEEEYGAPASEWTKLRGNGYVEIEGEKVYTELH
jgi:hypothetical protein